MNNEDYILTQIECTLLEQEAPDYFEVSRQGNFIYILSSKEDYKYYNLKERIRGIFYLLQFEHPRILQENSIIIETFTPEELKDLWNMKYNA